jgi:hypothetical protein
MLDAAIFFGLLDIKRRSNCWGIIAFYLPLEFVAGNIMDLKGRLELARGNAGITRCIFPWLQQ